MRHHLITGNQSVRYGAFVAGLLTATNCFGAPAWVPRDGMQRENALPALQFRLDTHRNRSWVLNHDAVHVHETASRRLIRRIELPGWLNVNEFFSCPPDIVITPTGAALVTSNILPTIWEIDPGSLEVREHRLVLDVDDDKDVGFIALAYARGGMDLIGVGSLPGSVWTIDLVTNRARRIGLPGPDPDTCGSTPGVALQAP